jgi:hypothetical protein
MSKARRGRDNRSIPTVDLSSEALEVERRQYHERIRTERAVKDIGSVEEALKEAAPRFMDKGWKVTRREQGMIRRNPLPLQCPEPVRGLSG